MNYSEIIFLVISIISFIHLINTFLIIGDLIEKCFQYWPDDVNKSLDFDHMQIEMIKEFEMNKNELIQRIFRIKSKKITF